MKRRDVLRTGAAAAALGVTGFGFGGSAFGQSKTVLKASDVHPLGYPTVEAVVRLGNKLEQQTGGRYSIQMFPSMQLGGEKEALEQAQVGALAFARVSVGVVGPLVDDLNVFNLPFVFRDTKHMRQVIDGPIGAELLGKITNNPQTRLVGLCWMDSGARNIYNKVRPIHSPEDLKGLKIRMMGNPLFVDTMNAMGGNGISMGMDQVYNAITTGVVDGAENNPPSYDSFNHYPIAKNYTISEHLIIPEILVMSRRTFDAMSKADQETLLKLSKEAQIEQRKLWDERTEVSMKKIREAGTNIVTLSAAEKQKFQDSVKPVWEKYGGKYAELVKRIQAVNS